MSGFFLKITIPSSVFWLRKNKIRNNIIKAWNNYSNIVTKSIYVFIMNMKYICHVTFVTMVSSCLFLCKRCFQLVSCAVVGEDCGIHSCFMPSSRVEVEYRQEMGSWLVELRVLALHLTTSSRCVIWNITGPVRQPFESIVCKRITPELTWLYYSVGEVFVPLTTPWV